MTQKIGTNIRALRKSRSLTQEQLAEALGVTGGAVYKWEAQLSTPDIDMLMALADFFETSVDALLGFELQSRNVDAILERMERFRQENDMARAMAEAERALQKYPNNFRVAYRCAVLYQSAAIAQPGEREAYGWRALELFRRACGLIDQNTEEQISLLSIQNRMASVYVTVGEYEKAVRLLKQNNQDGRNNARIGRILASNCRRAEEGLTYLSVALYDHMASLYDVVIGYVNAYSMTQENSQAIELMLWFLEAIGRLSQPGETSCLDRWAASLLMACAETAAEDGDWQGARRYLTQARDAALQFDAAPSCGAENLRFCHGVPERAVYGAGQETVMDDIYRHLRYEDEAGQRLLPLWEELEKGDHDETNYS